MSPAEADAFVFHLINNGLRNNFFDSIMPFVSSNAALVFAPLVMLGFLRERGNFLFFLAASVLGFIVADASCHLLKDFIGRQRPCHTLEGVNLLLGCGKSYSMPSSHASNAFAFAIPFVVMRRNATAFLAVFAALLVGFSRIYVGVHFPSDVAVGASLGILSAVISVRALKSAMLSFGERKYEQLLFIVLAALSLFRVYYILSGPLDLSPDEAHYWEWSRRPALSYYSKGPMTAYLIYAGTALFGITELGVRIFAPVFSALGSLLLYLIGREMFDRKTGFFSALLLQAAPLFAAFGVIFTIDAPFTFFWILSLYLFRKAVFTGDGHSPLWWMLLGLSVGAGVLTKYTMSLFYICAFLFLVSDKGKRMLLAKPWPYVSLLASFAALSPVIIWNAANNWVTVKHTAGQAHVSDGLTVSVPSMFDFVGSQLGVVTPLLLVLLVSALIKNRTDEKGRFLFWFSIPVVGFFFLKSIQGKVQANWAMPGYITGLIGFSAFYMKDFGKLGGYAKSAVAGAVGLAAVVTVVAHYPSVLGLPPDKNPAARLMGWSELGRQTDALYGEMEKEGPVFVFSDSYQIASELAFYMSGHPTTYCANLGRRMNQYDLWPGFQDFRGKNALFVKSGKNLPEKISKAFSKCDPRPISQSSGHGGVMKFTAFKCYDFKGIETAVEEKF